MAGSAGLRRWPGRSAGTPRRFRCASGSSKTPNLPDFESLDAARWRESVERGLRAWAEIGTADLELVLDEETVADDQGRAGDAINTIGFSSAERVAGRALRHCRCAIHRRARDRLRRSLQSGISRWVARRRRGRACAGGGPSGPDRDARGGALPRARPQRDESHLARAPRNDGAPGWGFPGRRHEPSAPPAHVLRHDPHGHPGAR